MTKVVGGMPVSAELLCSEIGCVCSVTDHELLSNKAHPQFTKLALQFPEYSIVSFEFVSEWLMRMSMIIFVA